MVVIPPGHDPLVTASFHREPLSQFDAVPTVGKIAKLSNIPAASKFIVAQLQKFIRTDVVWPNGICLHIPLKASISTGRGMQLSTLRKVRAKQRLDREQKTREEKEERKNSEKVQVEKNSERVQLENNSNSSLAEPFVEITSENPRENSRKSQSFPTQRRSTVSGDDFSTGKSTSTSTSTPTSSSTLLKVKERMSEAKKKIIEKAEQESKYIYADKYKEIKKQRELQVESNLNTEFSRKTPLGRPDPTINDEGDYTKSEVSSDWEGST